MDISEFELKLQDYLARFFRIYHDYTEENPQFMEASILQILHTGLKYLQKEVERTGADEPDWAGVSAMVPWPVDFDEEMVPQFFTVKPRDLRDERTVAKAILRHFAYFKALSALWTVTEGVAVCKKGDIYEVTYPPNLRKKVRRMPRARREKAERSLLHPEPMRFNLCVVSRSGSKISETLSVSLEVAFEPVYADSELKEAFYPIDLTLQIEGSRPQKWDRKDRREFWKSLLREVGSRIPQEGYEFLREVVEDSRLKEVKIRKLVSPEYASDCTELLQSYADCQIQHVEKTGKFLAVEGAFDLNKVRAQLSAKEEKDYERYKYLRYDTIHIPGTGRMKRSNRVLINGREAKVGDSVFPLLLRLVVELKKKKGGWVSIDVLDKEGIVPGPIEYRPYSRLRHALKPVLPERAAYDLVQADEAGHYRLSVHPDLVTYDQARLLEHSKEDIVKIAEHLPRSRKPKE